MRVLAFVIVITGLCWSVQYDNWRKPLYFAAAKGGYAKSSPSSMFWDDLGGAEVFDSLVWFSSEQRTKNHLLIEPCIQVGLLDPAPSDQKSHFLHGELLNEIRFNHLLIRQTLDVDSRLEYDLYYPGHPDRGARGRIEEAYCQVDWKYGFFRLGRANRNWGPFADRSLVLSSNPYTYDALEWQIHSKVFEFRHLVAAFPFEKNYWDADNESRWNRYLAAHSLSVMLGDWVTAGVTETVLFTRTNSIPDLQYINPFSIYTVTNTNQEGEGNLMLAFQWDIHPFIKSVALKGQVAFDDFQVDNEIETDKEPPHWGIDCGVYWSDPVQKFSLKHTLYAEFATLSEWMYTIPDNNANRGERYTYLKKSIGYPENDLSRFNAGVQLFGNNYWFANAEFSWKEKGEKQPTSHWNDNLKTPGLPFDTIPDIMETRVGARVNAHGYFRDYVDGWVGADLLWVKNKDHIKTTDFEFDPVFRIGLSVHFSDCYVKIP